MTEQPPNKMSQSPERGRHNCLRSHAATKGRLAGAAAMLTHGVATQHRATIGIAAYVPAIRTRRPTTPPTAGQASYSPAVKGPSSFSGANHALQAFNQVISA